MLIQGMTLTSTVLVAWGFYYIVLRKTFDKQSKPRNNWIIGFIFLLVSRLYDVFMYKIHHGIKDEIDSTDNLFFIISIFVSIVGIAKIVNKIEKNRRIGSKNGN